MGVTFTVYVAIDDNTPDCKAPFSNDPSVWSMEWDYGLVSCGDRKLFAALGFDINHEYPPPLVPLRGVDDAVRLPSVIAESLRGEEFTTWLNADELIRSVAHGGPS